MPISPPALTSDWNAPDSLWDWFFLAAIICLLVFMPFSLGVVEAWSELVVVCAAFLLAGGLLLRGFLDATFRPTLNRTFLLLLAILALIVVQLAPLPSGLVSSLSPQSTELRQNLLGDLAPNLAEGTSGLSTLSLYPYETAHDLRMAIVFTLLFVTAANVFRSATQIKRALLVVFVVGCLEAGIGLLQILTLSKKIHWMVAERAQVVTSGSFINYSHFCQFVNLTLGAGVALLLVRMKEDSGSDRGDTSRLIDLRSERYLLPLAGIVLCALAVLTSMSRNGAISLLIAAGVIGVLLYRRGVLSARGWLISMAPWCVLLILFLTCFDTIYDRLATLDDNQPLEQRLEATAGTLRAWRDFPVLGAGLGTHEYLFPLYDASATTSMAEHADNDWAQLLEEFGLLGGGVVLLFVLSIFTIASKLMLSGKTTLSTAAFGLSFGLLATAWHSVSDFGQHLPGIFSLTAVISGLLIAIARSEDIANFNPDYQAKKRLLWGIPASVLLLLTGWWTISGAGAAYRAEAWGNVALGYEHRLQAEKWQASDQDYVDLLTAAQHAAEAEPNNPKRSYMLNQYRWRSISRGRDPETGNIHLDPRVLPFVSQIADEIAKVRTLCPMYGPLYSLEGELRLLVLGEAAGSKLINQAAKLTPYHVATTRLAGQVAASEGHVDRAITLLNRTVALDPRQFQAVAGIYLKELQRPDLAEELAGNNYGRMLHLAQLLEKEVADADTVEPQKTDYFFLAEELRVRALARLRDLVDSGEASAGEVAKLANIEMRDNHPEAAIDLYRKALVKQYGQTAWRLALSRALLKAGDTEQALRQAKIVLRLKPQSRAAIKLIKETGVLPINSPEK